MKTSFAHIVVGAGALGSATAYWLARSGVRDVLVLEQFSLGHDRGASGDSSRIIRHAYHSPVYTALTQAAYDAWAHVEDETGLKLVLRTGGLHLAIAGSPGATELDSYRASLVPHGIPADDLDAGQIRARWPQWRIPDDVIGLFQRDGGILDIRRSVAAHVALARGLGVTFLPETRVGGVRSTDRQVTVATSRGTFAAESVVLCVASWLPELLGDLGLHWNIALTQEQVSWFATPNLRAFAPDRFPIWMWHGERLFYGFPVYGEVAVKAGRDLTGRFVTVEDRSYEPVHEETALVASFLREHLPDALGPELYSRTCVYDLAPDREFILDRAPGHPRIALAVGAGHMGKFASLFGRILADLATTGATAWPIEPFRATRPALTDPDFIPALRLA